MSDELLNDGDAGSDVVEDSAPEPEGETSVEETTGTEYEDSDTAEESVDDGEPETASEPERHKFKADGKEYEATIDELVNKYAPMGVDYTQKTQRLSQKEKRMEEWINNPQAVLEHYQRQGVDIRQYIPQESQQETQYIPVPEIDEEYASDEQRFNVALAKRVNEEFAKKDQEIAQLRNVQDGWLIQNEEQRLNSEFDTMKEEFRVPETAKNTVFAILRAGQQMYGHQGFGMADALGEFSKTGGAPAMDTVDAVKGNKDLYEQIKKEAVDEYLAAKQQRSKETKMPSSRRASSAQGDDGFKGLGIDEITKKFQSMSLDDILKMKK